MNPVKPEDEFEPVLSSNPPVNQPNSLNLCSGFIQGNPIQFLSESMQTLQSMTMTSTQTPQAPPCTLQYHSQMVNCMQCYYMPAPGGLTPFVNEGLQYLPAVPTASAQILEPPPSRLVPKREMSGDPVVQLEPTIPGDLSAWQQHKPSSSRLQGVAADNSHSYQKPTDNASQKRELRLMKNREAARECRRKKKEYVRCLEHRVAVLENQNKTLIQELKALQEIYQHKVE